MPRSVLFCGLFVFLCLGGNAQISPGPLSRAHTSLEGSTKCTLCHSFGLGTRKFKCTGCHTEIRQRLSEHRGFHARIVKNPGSDQECASCHTDHLGLGFNIVKWEPSHDEFDHRQTGYLLEGAHARVVCGRCHAASHLVASERKTIRVRDPNRTYLGLSTQCSSCHTDEHRGQLNSDCGRCHGFQSWKPAQSFDHATSRYPLTGLHAKVGCDRCHRTISDDSKPYVQYKNFPFASCSDCHRDPHKGAFPAGCQSCHATSGWKQVRESSTFDHNRTKFPLNGGHARVECYRCHKTSNFKEPVAHTACADCHSPDPHKGQFPGQDCARCHTEERWKPSLYDVQKHQTSGYPLLGKHAAVACDKCHAPAGRDTLYHVKHEACKDCHRDAHGGQFAGAPYRDGCQLCHTLEGFRPSTFDLAKHQGTHFPLSGGHAATACADCHQSPPGQLPPLPARYKFETLSCVGCHHDPHQGKLVASSKQDCNVCHSVRSWKQIAAFDHSTTSFALRGAHRAVTCAECHRSSDPAGNRQIVFTDAPANCAGCHEDVHGGQFFIDNKPVECSSCHDESAWKPSLFNHETRTTFSLKGAHQLVPCAQCHKEKENRDERSVVIYSRAPRRCAACHSNL